MRSFLYACYGELGDVLSLDPYSKALGTIEQEHLKIHAGEGFTLAARGVIANVGGIAEFLGIVPAGVFPHFRSMVVRSDGAPFDIDFFEAPTVTANGTPVAAFNNNRNSVNTPELTIYSAPTVTADGTSLEPVIAPGTKQSGALGSESSNEWILKAGTLYLIRITNNTAGAGNSNFTTNMFWYE